MTQSLIWTVVFSLLLIALAPAESLVDGPAEAAFTAVCPDSDGAEPAAGIGPSAGWTLLSSPLRSECVIGVMPPSLGVSAAPDLIPLRR